MGIMDQVENTLESQVKAKVTVVKNTCILVNQTKDMDTVLAKDTVDVLTKVEKDIQPLVVPMDQVKDTVDVLTKVEKDILPLAVHMDQVKDTVDVPTKVERDILPLAVHMDQVKDTVDVL